MSVPQCTRGQKSGTKQETATVCLLFICLKITVQWEAACGCWRVLPPWNASGGFGGLLGLLFLNRSRRVLGEPRNKWQDLISKNVFSCCFLCCPFPAGQEDIAADWPAGPHAVSCQILQTKEIRTRESPRAGWAFVTVGTDPFENVLPWFWDQSTELGDQRKPPPYYKSLLPELPGVPEAKALCGCWEKNSTALRIYQNQPYTSYTSDNLKHLAKSLAPGSDPETCGPILFCCNSRICQLLLSNWEEKNKRKPLLQKTEIHLNQSQTLQISKVIRTGRDWSVTYRGRQKPHVSLGSEVAGSGLRAKKNQGKPRSQIFLSHQTWALLVEEYAVLLTQSSWRSL